MTEHIRKKQIKQNTIEMKNIPDRINRRLKDVAEWVSDLENRVMESKKLNNRKEK